MNQEEQDLCLTEIRIKVSQISTDVAWIKRILAIVVVCICVILGIDPATFIHG